MGLTITVATAPTATIRLTTPLRRCDQRSEQRKRGEEGDHGVFGEPKLCSIPLG